MYKIVLWLMLLGCLACHRRDSDLQAEAAKYPRWVGDIEYDSKLDDPSFKTCNGENVDQYFNHGKGMRYRGEKRAIEAIFQRKYHSVTAPSANGYIRIRFIVNCKGETGRFRLIGMDENYQLFDFPKEISDQLLAITKRLKNWEILPNEESPRDYYQYLIFKIEQGTIKEILP